MKLDPSSQGTGMTKKEATRMTGEGTAVIKEPVSATFMTPLKEMNRLFKIVLNRGITFTSKISYYHFLIYVL